MLCTVLEPPAQKYLPTLMLTDQCKRSFESVMPDCLPLFLLTSPRQQFYPLLKHISSHFPSSAMGGPALSITMTLIFPKIVWTCLLGLSNTAKIEVFSWIVARLWHALFRTSERLLYCYVTPSTYAKLFCSPLE